MKCPTSLVVVGGGDDLVSFLCGQDKASFITQELPSSYFLLVACMARTILFVEVLKTFYSNEHETELVARSFSLLLCTIVKIINGG